LAVVCSGAIGLAAQQRPAGPPAPEGRGAISGVVTDEGSNRPIAGALVTLTAGSILPGGRRQVADAMGRFVFTGLPAGSFTAAATRFGYFDGGYGRASARAGNRRIVLGEGEWFADAQIRLWRTASMTGRVLDERGEPVVDVWVRALAEIFIAGRAQWVAGPLTKTDDRGAYRVAGLTPGRWTIVVPSVQSAVPDGTPPHALAGMSADAAALLQAEGRLSLPDAPALQVGDHRVVLIGGAPVPPPSAAGRPQVYPITFYSSARTVAEAQIIDLSSGEARAGVDVALRPVPAFTIAGRLDGESSEGAGTILRLLASGVPDVGIGAEAGNALTGSDGRFLFANVAAGRYTIVTSPSVSAYSYAPASAATAAFPQPPGLQGSVLSSSVSAAPAGTMLRTSGARDAASFGQTDLVVDDASLSDVRVALEPGGVISGRVVSEPAPAGSPARLPISMILAESADGDPSLGRPTFRFDRAKPSLEFRIQGLRPGAYLLQTLGGGLVKSVEYDGRDYTSQPLEIRGGQEISGVVVTLTRQGAELTGFVRDAQGRPLTSNSVVLCFPAESESWARYGTQPQRLRAATVSDDGSYRFTSLPGGDYLVVALDDAHAEAWHNPAFLAKIAPLASKVVLDWGEQRNESLTFPQLP
jgi:hypothetical protein